MSLVKCPGCGNEVSSAAHECPHCGKALDMKAVEPKFEIKCRIEGDNFPNYKCEKYVPAQIYRDTETGVNYISMGGETLCPRYNSDGTLYVD